MNKTVKTLALIGGGFALLMLWTLHRLKVDLT